MENEADTEQLERGVVAAGIAKAGSILSNSYYLVITNVPYLVFNKQSELLHKFCNSNYPSSDNDLATVFITRCLKLIPSNGLLVIVSPQNWLYQIRYKSFRKQLLTDGSINFISRLGSGAFEVISGEVVKVTLAILNKKE